MKKSEIEKLSLEDLQDKLAEFKSNSDLKMNHAVSPLEKSLTDQNYKKNSSPIINGYHSKQNEIIA